MFPITNKVIIEKKRWLVKEGQKELERRRRIENRFFCIGLCERQRGSGSEAR